TKDIAIGIRTPIEKAEEIKKTYGCAFSPLVRGNEYVSVPGVGGREQREVSKAVLASIVEPRLEEILSLALREIKRTEYADMLGAGIVLTGGGSLMEGTQELAERVFEMPVKLGLPTGFGGLTEAARSPVHATGVGLCMYGVMQAKAGKQKPIKGGSFGDLWDRMKGWLSEFF
ncbi:MAG: cell division protein FtsA, partial [Chitinivibrionales bacterium]|nr:cell division protein FtsA [Chitinivibrionales bacterium]MBD3395231.1 cell division protein FtsA [Chitinivibrionales bacterium]